MNRYIHRLDRAVEIISDRVTLTFIESLGDDTNFLCQVHGQASATWLKVDSCSARKQSATER